MYGHWMVFLLKHFMVLPSMGEVGRWMELIRINSITPKSKAQWNLR